MTYVGRRLARVEDERLVQGKGRYVGDLRFPGMVWAGFVRSPHAHARILRVDLDQARSLPGVIAAYAAADLPEVARPTPVSQTPSQLKGHGIFPLAPDRARYVGEAVAVILAEDRQTLADAVELADVEYEPIEAAADLEVAMDEGPLVWEDAPRNVAAELTLGFGDVDDTFGGAEIVVEERFSLARTAGAALEPRAVAAVPGGEGDVQLTLWDSTQAPHNVRDAITAYLGLSEDAVRVIVPDVGGGFGPKGRVYPEEYVVAALALRHGRAVSFAATRTEDLLTTGQGGGLVIQARLAARADGSILAIDHRIVQDIGAYSAAGLGAAMNTVRHVMGPYRVPAARVKVEAVYTNRVMTSPLRGGGRQYGIYVMERLLDRLAERLSLGRDEVRRRNFIPPEAFPYDTGMPVSGGSTIVYDGGSYPSYLQRALETIESATFRGRQEEARKEGRYLGLGLAAFIESTGVGVERARIRLSEDGSVLVQVGSPSTGQGHATAFAQMAADRVGVPIDTVAVVSGDTGAVPSGTGTFASRMGQCGGNAVSLAARTLRERILALAADMLEIAADDLELTEGCIRVKGVPDRTLSVGDVAREAARRGELLEADETFEPSRSNTWAGGVNAAIVEVDPETGRVVVLRYVVVHDAGRLVNPTIVEGQIQGAVVHGIGNVLLEECVYDDAGQLATATFADYLIAGTGDAPMVEAIHFETPSPFNPEGIKGVGEGGTIAAIPTIVSAIEDALLPFGVEIRDIPVRPEEIAMVISEASQVRRSDYLDHVLRTPAQSLVQRHEPTSETAR